MNSVAASAAEWVRTRIDAIATNTMFRVDAHVQRKERRDDARQHARRRNHEHDYHLQSRGLRYVRATQDRTCHRTRDGDDAYHAAERRQMSWAGRAGWLFLTYLIWLMVGIRARRRDSIASGRQASKRDAPNASSVSVLSWFSLQQPVESVQRIQMQPREAHSSSLRRKLSSTETPASEFPHCMPTMGTIYVPPTHTRATIVEVGHHQ